MSSAPTTAAPISSQVDNIPTDTVGNINTNSTAADGNNTGTDVANVGDEATASDGGSESAGGTDSTANDPEESGSSAEGGDNSVTSSAQEDDSPGEGQTTGTTSDGLQGSGSDGGNDTGTNTSGGNDGTGTTSDISQGGGSNGDSSGGTDNNNGGINTGDEDGTNQLDDHSDGANAPGDNIFKESLPIPDIECGDGTEIATVYMADAIGDGWEGTQLAIIEDSIGDTDGGQTVFKGSLENNENARGESLCLKVDLCYRIIVDGGMWMQEVRWGIGHSSVQSENTDLFLARNTDLIQRKATRLAPADCSFSLYEACQNSCKSGYGENSPVLDENGNIIEKETPGAVQENDANAQTLSTQDGGGNQEAEEPGVDTAQDLIPSHLLLRQLVRL